MSKSPWIRTIVLPGLLLLASAAAYAAEESKEGAAAPVIEPEALAALDRMGEYLRSLSAFELTSDATIDEVTDDGMKLQFGGTVMMQVQRPDRFRIEIDSDRKQRQFIYDGKTLTLYGAKVGYYATVPAPATIKEVVAVLKNKYDIEMPLADLFSWGTDDSLKSNIKEAAVIGPSKIGGVTCDHIAVRQEGVDWQVWIEQGKTALPHKMVITTKDEAQQPQYVSVLHWTTSPKFADDAFEFKPPMEAHKIPLESASVASK
jgi:hypothetical protein